MRLIKTAVAREMRHDQTSRAVIQACGFFGVVFRVMWCLSIRMVPVHDGVIKTEFYIIFVTGFFQLL